MRYSALSESEQIFASKYKTILPRKTSNDAKNEAINDIIKTINSKQIKLFEKLYADSSIKKNEIAGILYLEYIEHGIKRGNTLNFQGKVNTLIAAAKVTPETLDKLDKYGLDKKRILLEEEAKLASNI